MKYLFTTLSLLAIITIKAQTSGQIANYGSTATSGADANAQLNAVLGPMQEAEAKLTYKKEEFQGSPYTHDLFLPTNLFYKNEDLGLIFYRYNAYNEEIEIKRQNIEGEGIQALGRDKQISIRVNNKTMSFKTFIDDETLEDGLCNFHNHIESFSKDNNEIKNVSFVKINNGKPLFVKAETGQDLLKQLASK